MRSGYRELDRFPSDFNGAPDIASSQPSAPSSTVSTSSELTAASAFRSGLASTLPRFVWRRLDADLQPVRLAPAPSPLRLPAPTRRARSSTPPYDATAASCASNTPEDSSTDLQPAQSVQRDVRCLLRLVFIRRRCSVAVGRESPVA